MANAILLVFGLALGVCVTNGADSQERFFIFDVTGDFTADDVITKMDGMPVEYIFKVTLANRFIIVMPELPQERLRNVAFSGAKVTPYSVERMDAFFARYGADQSNEELNDLPILGDGVTLVEVDFHMDDLTFSEYADQVKRMGNHLQTVHLSTPIHGFNVLGQLPVKILSFVYHQGKVAEGFEKVAGSLSLFRLKATPIMRIK